MRLNQSELSLWDLCEKVNLRFEGIMVVRSLYSLGYGAALPHCVLSWKRTRETIVTERERGDARGTESSGRVQRRQAARKLEKDTKVKNCGIKPPLHKQENRRGIYERGRGGSSGEQAGERRR